MIWLRSAAFNLWFYAVTTVFSLGSPVVRLRAARSGGRHAIMAYARIWARTVLAGLRPLVGINWRVIGADRLPRGGALIAAQHQSVFETLLWTILLPDFAFVLKRELLMVPLFGGMLRAAGMIAIDRSAGPASIRVLLRAGADAAAAGRQIVIFPEGTRVAPGESMPLQSGIAALAARTGLPVIPIVTDSGRLWGRHAFRKRPGTIRVEVLPPIVGPVSREVLLSQLEALFAAGPLVDAAAGRPVDNIVDDVAAGFPRHSRRNSQMTDNA